MKRITFAIFGSLLLPTAFVASDAIAQAAVAAQPAASAPTVEPGFVMSGWGEVETEITRARLKVEVQGVRLDRSGTFDLSAASPEKAEAQSKGEKIMQEILAAVEGIATPRTSQGAESGITIESMGVDNKTMFYPRVIADLRVPKIDDLPAVCRALSAIPRARVSDLEVFTADPGADRLSAISAAAKDAREDAAAYAGALGIRLVKLRRVQVQSGGTMYNEGPREPVWNNWTHLEDHDVFLSEATIPETVPKRMKTVSLVFFEYDIDESTPQPIKPAEDGKAPSPN